MNLNFYKILLASVMCIQVSGAILLDTQKSLSTRVKSEAFSSDIPGYDFEPENITPGMEKFFASVRSSESMNSVRSSKSMDGATLDLLLKLHILRVTAPAVAVTLLDYLRNSGVDQSTISIEFDACNKEVIHFTNTIAMGNTHIQEYGTCYDDTNPLGYLYYAVVPAFAEAITQALKYTNGTAIPRELDDLLYYAAVEGRPMTLSKK